MWGLHVLTDWTLPGTESQAHLVLPPIFFSSSSCQVGLLYNGFALLF